MDSWRLQRPLLEDGNLIIDGEIVVSQCEESLQHALADFLCTSPDTRVLEIGYGLGLAHNRIRKHHPSEHWVIEGNKWLAKRCIDFFHDSQSSLPVVIADTWEHAITTLRQSYYDAILFDPYPFDESAKQLVSWAEKFAFVAYRAADELSRVLRPGGILGVINFDPINHGEKWMVNQFRDLFEVDQAIRFHDISGLGESWILKKRT